MSELQGCGWNTYHLNKFRGDVEMNLGEGFPTQTYFCIYCGRGIYFH